MCLQCVESGGLWLRRFFYTPTFPQEFQQCSEGWHYACKVIPEGHFCPLFLLLHPLEQALAGTNAFPPPALSLSPRRTSILCTPASLTWVCFLRPGANCKGGRICHGSNTVRACVREPLFDASESFFFCPTIFKVSLDIKHSLVLSIKCDRK